MHVPLGTTNLTTQLLSIETSPASQMFWADFIRQYNPYVDLGEHGSLKQFPQFASEVFHRLYYDFEPQFKRAIAPEAKWAETLHHALSANEQFQTLAYECSGNPVAAGLATIEVTEKLIELLPKPDRDIDSLDTLRYQARKAAREGNQKQLEQLQAQGKAAGGRALTYADSLEHDQADQVAYAIAIGIDQASQTIQEKAGQFAMLGIGWGNEPGSYTQVALDQRLELAKQLEQRPKLREILDMAGRMFETALEKRRKAPVESGYGELIGVTTGASLGRLLPSELGKLSSLSQRLLFYKDFTERNLLEYELQAPEPKGKGPLILCLDTSSSMEGSPEIWAKGLAVALARLATKDNRDMAIIPFSHELGPTVLLKACDRNWETILNKVIGLYMGGGTEFNLPLNAALDIIDQASNMANIANIVKADILFLTDGEANVSHRVQKRLKDTQSTTPISLLTIMVGVYTPHIHDLEDISDSIWNVKDLITGTTIGTTIEELLERV